MNEVTAPTQKTLGRYYHDTYQDEVAYEAMIIGRCILVRNHAFWGYIGLDLVMVEDQTGFIPTMATDGRHLFYNANFVKSLKGGEVVFGIAHEISHCMYEHVEDMRKGDRDHMLWNFAIDYVTNGELVEDKVGEFIKTVPILYDEKYKGWYAEQVYDDLLKNPPPSGGQTFDIHIEIDGGGDGEGEGNAKVSPDGKSITIKMSQEEYDKLKKSFQDKVRSALHDSNVESQGIGSMPANLRRIVESMMQPRVDWRTSLRRYLTMLPETGYSWSKPNKALFNTGMTLPGNRTRNPFLEVDVAWDTSGSVGGDDLGAYASEFAGMLKQFARYRVRAWCFDAQVMDESYTEINESNKTSLTALKPFLNRVTGGGGTDIGANWDWMIQKKIRPKCLIVFTDGGSYRFGIPRYCPTIFLVKGNPGFTAPFGKTIHYENGR